MSDIAAEFARAHAADEPFPSLTTAAPGTTLADAYATQAAFVGALPGRVVGYKGALTAAPAQAAMGIDAPVSGVLFDWGAHAPGATISPRRPVMLETELGYRLGQAITAPVDADGVLAKMATCHPMIELASPNLAGKANGLDLIAANAASYGYIEGPGTACDSLSVDAITATFTLDGEPLHEAASSTVMEGQANALAWLVNHVLETGGELAAGMLLMTGAIGPPHPGKPGAYRAEFGPLGVLEFSLGAA